MNLIISLTKKISFEIKISFLYALIGMSWIYFSDTFFGGLVSEKQTLMVLQIYKGFFYIIITTLLLYYLVKRHISQINAAQGKAIENQTKFEAITNQATEGIALSDLNGNYKFVNPAFCAMTGFSEKELLNMTLFEIQSKAVSLKNFSDNKSEKETPPFEATLKRKDNSLVITEIIGRVIKIGKEDFILSTVRDITEKKEMIDDLVIAKELAEQSNQLKDAFMANMSHEIRTPLNGILGMTSIIKETFASHIGIAEEQYFNLVDKSSRRIIRTIDLILNYSRMHVGTFTVNLKEVDISLLCRNLIEEFEADAKTRTLDLSFKNNIGKVIIRGDAYALEQAISNLVDNAVKYTLSGFVQLQLDPGENDEILLSVKDTGIGISDTYLARIFEPYTQEQIGYGREFEGVGLGLALVKKILDMNDAPITVQTKKGEGTTFTIRLRRLIKEERENIFPETGAAGVVSSEPKNDHTILVVEDDLINQNTIRMFLEPLYNTVITNSSDDTLELLKKNKIDIILMDISIDGSMDGLVLTKKIKTMDAYRHLPIIAVTAHAFEIDRINSLAAGCDDYLSKPFTKERLLEKIKELISSM